jgi:Flp pilus assembly protein TadG
MDVSKQDAAGCRKIGDNETGQALVEFALSAAVLVVLVFGLIDLGRAIYVVEVITNLTGEGSSLASRGTSLSDTAAAVVVASTPLNFSTNGRVIVSSVFNNNNVIQLTGQVSQGGLAASSRIGSVIGTKATVPAAAAPQLNQTAFVTEVFYKYQPITPIGNLLNQALFPLPLYDAAYY